jgi:hypothetical protein
MWYSDRAACPKEAKLEIRAEIHSILAARDQV